MNMIRKKSFFAVFAMILILASSCTEEELSNTITDIDGNVYHTVKIGTQTWMVENLKTTKYNDGTNIPYMPTFSSMLNFKTPGYCFYGFDTINMNIYGALYNWYTVNTGKLAPVGWHVPTDAEWTTLENYLITFKYNGTAIGNRGAKALAASSGWPTSYNEDAVGNDLSKNNITGFSALPGGNLLGGGSSFYEIGVSGYWWSSTQSSSTSARGRTLNNNSSLIGLAGGSKQQGFSVRCVQD